MVDAISRETAEKVLEVVDAGLSAGLGKPEPGHMCVEAAVCYAMGLPHSDKPSCVSPAVRRLKIRLNDSRWSSNEARAKGLRRLAVAQLGTAGAIDDKAFSKRAAEIAIRQMVPVALRAAAAADDAAAAADAAAGAAYAAAAADAAASDRTLSEFAEAIVQVLIEMKAPGCEFLDLAAAA